MVSYLYPRLEADTANAHRHAGESDDVTNWEMLSLSTN